MDLGLTFSPSKNPLKGYADADRANCLVDRRSCTGYTFMLNSGTKYWDSTMQRISSTEAEYMALTEATKEAIHIQGFFSELEFDEVADVKMFNDKMGAQCLAENPKFYAKNKHIDVRHRFVCDALRNKLLKLEHVSTDNMIADVITKGLPGNKYQQFVKLLGLGHLNFLESSSTFRGEVLECDLYLNSICG